MTVLVQNREPLSKTDLLILETNLPHKKASTPKTTIIPCKLTTTREAILGYLVEWRFGTSTQIWRELQRGKFRNHTVGDLEKLRDAGLIRSLKISPEKGEHSELCWILLPLGAKAVNAVYNNQYAIKPGQQRIFLRDMELELARTIKLAGWQLIKPGNYSPHKPMPKQTPQYHKLAESIEAIEMVRIKTALVRGQISQSSQTFINYKEHQHLWGLPGQLNDYVAFIDANEAPGAVVVLMLCPPNTGRKAWEARLEKYSKIAKYLPVYGVFPNEEARVIGQKILATVASDQKNKRLMSGYGANLKTTTLVDVFEMLDSIPIDNPL